MTDWENFYELTSVINSIVVCVIFEWHSPISACLLWNKNMHWLLEASFV